MSENYALQLRHITKSFPGVKALNDVSFDVRYGTVHSIVGENGAGKSTLMKIINGMHMPNSGEILVNGEKQHITSPQIAKKLGISMIFQELVYAPNLSVAENLCLGDPPRTKVGFVDWKTMREQADEILKIEHIHTTPNAMMYTVPISDAQMMEIVKATYHNAKIVIMDEPTSSLTQHESERLFDKIRRLKEEGCAVIYISHKMDEIFRLSDYVTIMRDGCSIKTAPIGEFTEKDVISMMVGREVSNLYPTREESQGEDVLRVTNLSGGVFKDVNFHVRAGEIVCIAGIDGNGQTELVYALTGLEPAVSGKITLEGKDITHASIRQRSLMGMSHIPEDRHKHGLVLDYTLEDNMVLQRYFEPEFTDKAGFLRRKNIRAYAEGLIEQYDVRAGQGPVTPARSMSGGNQQKAIVAREIDKHPELLVAVQPTRGLDVGAIEYIHKQLVAQRDAGKAVLLVSLELDEVMDVPDRILVMYEGEIVGELDPKSTTQEELGLYMAGAKRDEVKA